MNKTAFEFDNVQNLNGEFSNRSHSIPEPKDNFLDISAASFTDVDSHKRSNSQAAPMMGMKKHRPAINFPQPNLSPKAGSSSPLTLLNGKIRTGNINPANFTNSWSGYNPNQTIGPKTANSTMSAAGAGIKQGLVNVGKFLQAAQYVITLTLVFSLAWFPFLAVVCADTLTKTFGQGIHEIDR